VPSAGEPLFRLDSDVESVDFERLLSILYPPCVTRILKWSKVADAMFSEFGKYALTKLVEWTSVLHLASKWGFESIRSLALCELLPLAPPVDKIVLGRKYGFDDWLTPTYVAVCARAEPLSLAEAEKMSNADVTRIFQARERARSSSASVDSAMAQKAVVCIFGEGDETAVAFPSGMNDSSSPSATGDLNLRAETPHLEDDPSENLPAGLPASIDEVDDGLIDALLAWSRVCSRLDDLSFDTSPSDPSYRAYSRNSSIVVNYARYRAEYESALAYVVSPQLREASLRHFLSMTLQRCFQSTRPELYVQFWKELRNRMGTHSNDAGGDCAAMRLETANFNQMLEERCLEFVSNECALAETHSNPFTSRQALAQLVNNLANASLLSDMTLRACILLLVPLLEHPGPSYDDLKNLLAFLKSKGKSLDREFCHNLMDIVFAKLRRHALDWKFRNLHQQIIVSACFSRVSC
jgi:hypothetical protein